MIKVAVLTTVWERARITIPHFYWMNRFKGRCRSLDIDLKPFYVLSAGDKHFRTFRRSLGMYRHSHIINNSKRLSDKSQDGLEAILPQYDFDYLMHLDSDEFLSIRLMEHWREQFEKGTKWFGSSSCYFVGLPDKDMYEFLGYDDHPVKNGGTCLHRELLEDVDWTLWERSRNSGLNVMERKRIEKFGFELQPIDVQDTYGVVEIKGGQEAIHPLDWFEKRNLLRELADHEESVLKEEHSVLELIR